MTLYFRRVKLRNPFKPSHKAYFETVLGAEAERKKKAERAAKKAEIKRRESLVRLEGRERVWKRAVHWVRGLRHHSLLRPMIEPSIKAEGEAGIDGDEDEVIRDEEGEQSEEIWEGDWTSIFEYYE
ncbi:hypothetical protein HBI42_025450 [Parastagonospora nodorum]|nr:hypothetical protein HBI11_217430 [Parastagonospora nodorum]KAH5434056.1 hypothetical protein HBI32_043290 [Parastagonospora nodorum]KAH6075341.1 hypothetical protein HBI67_052490 [Parastagonospora nodorum]KAH6089036.1 hypothetical protein HBI66_027230 [Parastagonospora nodorum]KAH6231344.1 hypothetical protein HBI43_037660 [Parastagonospora nodorum]